MEKKKRKLRVRKGDETYYNPKDCEEGDHPGMDEDGICQWCMKKIGPTEPRWKCPDCGGRMFQYTDGKSTWKECFDCKSRREPTDPNPRPSTTDPP